MVNQDRYFWRFKKMMASLESGYKSESDSDYHPGDIIEEVKRPKDSVGETDSCLDTSYVSSKASGGRKRNVTVTSSVSTLSESKDRKKNDKIKTLPYWVRALSLPERYDPDLEKFVPVDPFYKEEKDPDYVLPETDVEDSTEEEEDTEDVELLLKEVEEELPESLSQGQHRTSKETVSPVKVTLTPIKEGDNEKSEEDQIVLVDDKPRALPLWVKEIGVIDQSEEYNSEDDPEFVPPAVLLESDVDYDEYSDDQDEVSEEAGILLSESSLAVEPPASYIPIWVKIESPLERIARAKKNVDRCTSVLADKGETSGKDTDP